MTDFYLEILIILADVLKTNYQNEGKTEHIV